MMLVRLGLFPLATETNCRWWGVYVIWGYHHFKAGLTHCSCGMRTKPCPLNDVTIGHHMCTWFQPYTAGAVCKPGLSLLAINQSVSTLAKTRGIVIEGVEVAVAVDTNFIKGRWWRSLLQILYWRLEFTSLAGGRPSTLAVSRILVRPTAVQSDSPIHMHAWFGWMCMCCQWEEERKLLRDTGTIHFSPNIIWRGRVVRPNAH